ncbi:MAG: hypothetical protein JXK93_10090 [Sphaerochaetaceae bacterium]|nr:hypothetical protein [Sphaerochaetaceae bacterium]
MKRLITLIMVSLILLTSLQALSFEPFFEYEAGAISILSHTYQNGVSSSDPGTLFDFRDEGGQDVLYPFERFQIGARIDDRHRVWFSYQPLELVTNVTFREDVSVGNYDFVAGTPMKLTYSFPFYRLSYTYDLLGEYENAYLGPGLVLQIRNASIRFESLTAGAESLYVTQNVGLVPALALYSEYRFPFGVTLSADIAGSYADSAFFNGADYEFSGSILDASLRMAYQTTDRLALFGNLRYFGGTSKGTSDGDDSWSVSETNFSQNNIASITASVGALITF